MPHCRSDLHQRMVSMAKKFDSWPLNQKVNVASRHVHREPSITPERQTPISSTTDRKSCLVESLNLAIDGRVSSTRSWFRTHGDMVALSCACLATRGVEAVVICSEGWFFRRQVRIVGMVNSCHSCLVEYCLHVDNASRVCN